MNPYQNTMSKLNQLPEPLLKEVNQFIDALLLKENTAQKAISSLQQTDNLSIVPDLDTYPLMQLAETGFTEWNDPEEDIYNDAA